MGANLSANVMLVGLGVEIWPWSPRLVPPPSGATSQTAFPAQNYLHSALLTLSPTPGAGLLAQTHPVPGCVHICAMALRHVHYTWELAKETFANLGGVD